MSGPPDPTTNFCSGSNQPIRVVSADLSNRFIATSIKVSLEFESQAESFSRKPLDPGYSGFKCGSRNNSGDPGHSGLGVCLS